MTPSWIDVGEYVLGVACLTGMLGCALWSIGRAVLTLYKKRTS